MDTKQLRTWADSYEVATVLTPSLPKTRMQIALHCKKSSHFNGKLKGNSGSCSKNEKQKFYIQQNWFSGVKDTQTN